MKNIYILIAILLLILVLSSLGITEGFDDKDCSKLGDIVKQTDKQIDELNKQIDELNKKKEDAKKSCINKLILKNGLKDVACNPEKYGLTKDDFFKYDMLKELMQRGGDGLNQLCRSGLDFDN